MQKHSSRYVNLIEMACKYLILKIIINIIDIYLGGIFYERIKKMYILWLQLF